MNSITKYQLAAAVLLSEGFTLLCIRGSITLLTLAGYTAGTLLQYAAAVPVMKLCRSGLSDCGKPALAVILLCLTGWGGISLALLYQTSDAVYIPFEGSGLAGELLISALIALVSLYAASAGIRSLARAAVMVSALGVLCIAAVAFSAVLSSSPEQWERIPRIPGSRSLLREVLHGFTAGSGTAAFSVLYCRAGKGSGRLYFAGKLLLTWTVMLVSMLAAGGIMAVTDHPAVTAAQLTQPFPAQRIDSLFMVVFSVAAVFSVSLQGVCAVHIAGMLFPGLRCRSCIVLGGIMLAGALLRNADLFSAPAAVLTVLSLLALPAGAAAARYRTERRCP